GIVDEDSFERLFTGTQNAETFETLFTARATFTVAIDHARDAVHNAIAVTECLDSFSDCFGRVRSSLHDLAAKTLCGKKHDVRIRRRRWTSFRSLNDSLLPENNASRRLLRKRDACKREQQSRAKQKSRYSFHHLFLSIHPALPRSVLHYSLAATALGSIATHDKQDRAR